MNVLYLGPENKKLIRFIKSNNDSVVRTEAPINPDSKILQGIDFLISYRYRYILKKEVLDHFPHRAINLHISLLPWNKGSDPNLWSFLENTPKGVTIHYIDSGLDTGDIIAQKELHLSSDETLKSSYEKLSDAIETLFMSVWLDIRNGNISSFPQPSGGSYHRKVDKEKYQHLLFLGYDTPVSYLIGKAL